MAKGMGLRQEAGWFYFRLPPSAFLLCCAIVANAAMAQTENYPNKPVRIISPFPPGGSVDLIGRLVAAKLTENLGQQVVVDNRPGASGNIGMELAARATPDGYTLLTNTLPFITNAFLYSKLPYDSLNDFAPIMLISSSPNLLAVHPSMPLRSVKDLLALARAKPGALNYATAGPATNPHVAGELFNFLGKTNIVAVHFKGGGPALVAAMSGEVGIAFSNVAETSEFVRSGRLRGLGVTSTKRVAALPEIPTIAESGLPGYEFTTWNGVWAPKGTPRVIIALLNERMKKVMAAPDQVKRFNDRGMDVIASTPEEFATFLQVEHQKWGKVIKERGMKAD
jgi:tripartite-type tricarboxylate transporter receptor subunit TctC